MEETNLDNIHNGIVKLTYDHCFCIYNICKNKLIGIYTQRNNLIFSH